MEENLTKLFAEAALNCMFQKQGPRVVCTHCRHEIPLDRYRNRGYKHNPECVSFRARAYLDSLAAKESTHAD